MHYDAMFDVGLDTDEEEVIWMRKSDMEHPDGIHELNLAKVPQTSKGKARGSAKG